MLKIFLEQQKELKKAARIIKTESLMLREKDMLSIFFGAGKNCKYMIEIWRFLGKKPAYIIDSNCLKWETQLDGIQIYGPNKLTEIQKDDIIYVTCRYEKKIQELFAENKIETKQIICCDGFWKAASEYVKRSNQSGLIVKNQNQSQNKQIIFDLENGLTLGGIENWVFQESERLRAKGWSTVFISPSGKKVLATGQQVFNNELYDYNDSSLINKINQVTQYILRFKGKLVVSNFGGVFFYGVCIAKKIAPQKIRHIVIIHNDLESFYDRYVEMQEYIDECYVISKKMEVELQKRNFCKNKINHLIWNIYCTKKIYRNYAIENMPLRIGYAGRVTISQKRFDRCLEVAKMLQKSGVRFHFQVAGTGDYLEQLKIEIQENGLCKEIELLGYLEQSEINKFWSGQDIMISCSEYEGHSITQMEAMAAGAVPIIMDVSGAIDDITNNENGFIIEQGDIRMMANKICLLNEDRMKLQMMGKKAHEMIYLKMQNAKNNGLI